MFAGLVEQFQSCSRTLRRCWLERNEESIWAGCACSGWLEEFTPRPWPGPSSHTMVSGPLALAPPNRLPGQTDSYEIRMMWIFFFFFYLSRINIYIPIFISSNISSLSPLADWEAPKSLLSLRWCFQLCRCKCLNSTGLIWKRGTLWDACKHNAGGGVGGGRHTRVWRVSCQLTQRKLKCSTTKTSVSVSIFTQASRKDNTHSAYSGLDSFLFFRRTDGNFTARSFTSTRRNGREENRSRSTGGGWEKGVRGERLGEQGGRRDGPDLCNLCQG